MHTILLYGGGIDSSTLLAFLAKQTQHPLTAMFIRYGQKAEALELEACSHFCNKYGVPLVTVGAPFSQLTESAIMKHGTLANDPSVNIVDGRNFALISMAGMYAAKVGAEQVAMGYHVEPVARPFPDASIEFVHAINRMIPFAFKHRFEVVAPFSEWTRDQIFAWAKHNDSEILRLAHTCYEDVPGGCGICTHCLLKKEILENI